MLLCGYLCDSLYIGALLKLSGLVDEDYYKSKYPDVAASGMDPAMHFASFGWKEKRCPARHFEGLALENDGQSFGEYLESMRAQLEARREKAQRPKILRQGSYEALYDMPLRVDWGVTHMCNYRCSYCFGQTPLDKTKFPPMRDFVNALDNLATLDRPGYSFNFGGGEPTSYPSFLEFLHNPCGQAIGQDKEGSDNYQWFQKFGIFQKIERHNFPDAIEFADINPYGACGSRAYCPTPPAFKRQG